MPAKQTGPIERKWYDSAYASLCGLGAYLQRTGFFAPLEAEVHIHQKALRYTPIQKLEMLFVSLLAGAKAVAHTGLTLRVDRALQVAFGLPGCADQSVLADTLDAATDADVAALRRACDTLFRQHSATMRQVRHELATSRLTLDLDLSPCPTGATAEGAERSYMGRYRAKTGRRLIRVRAAPSQEILWEDVRPGRTAESLAVLQEAVGAVEHLLGLGDVLDDPLADEAARHGRTRVEWRLDSGWGGQEMIDWLLARGYQVTGKLKAWQRVAKLTRAVASDAWQPTSSPGREVAEIPSPLAFARPTHQYAVRTPAAKKPDGFYHAVLFTTREDLTIEQTVDHYDARAGIEADLKSDKHGLGLARLRKRKLAAQRILVLLSALAHNVLLWARRWLGAAAPRLTGLGIVRLLREVWAIPGRVKLSGASPGYPVRICLRLAHPRAADVGRGLRPLLDEIEPILVVS
jgi:Transposase DDE domain group 1